MIEVQNLVKTYGDHMAVDHLNFTVEKGKIYGFLGPNGAGKSTTMNMMTGYLASTSGDIVIDGHDILKEPEEAKKCVGYLPEVPPLYMEMTPYEQLHFSAELKGIRKDEREERIVSVMKQTGIEDMADRMIRHLSKGYRQRVGLAQALLGDPKILILDEPTAGLDPKGRDEILDQIAELHKARGITIILVSHSMEDVAKYVERLIVVNHGKIAFDDTPKKVFAHYKELEEMGLAAPQITYIMHALKEKGLPVDPSDTTVEEARADILRALKEMNSPLLKGGVLND